MLEAPWTDLLFAFVFCSCSSCLAYHSSSSFIAFSFHSASCFRELASLKGRKRKRTPMKQNTNSSEFHQSILVLLSSCCVQVHVHVCVGTKDKILFSLSIH